MDLRTVSQVEDKHSVSVLVTGANGFIGQHLVKMLFNNGFRVRTYTRTNLPGSLLEFVGEKDRIIGELSDKGKIQEACADVEVVVHAAGVAHTRSIKKRVVDDVNVLGTQNLYLACERALVKKFIFLSSILALEPSTSVYAASKEAAERFLTSQGARKSITKSTVLRPTNVYGPSMRGGLPIFIRLARLGLIPALPDTKNTFSLVSVFDLCRVVVSEVTNTKISNSVSIYTVTDGQTYTPNRVENAVYSCLCRDIPAFKIPKAGLFLLSLVARLANIFGLIANEVGPRLYRNLMNGRQAYNGEQNARYDFVPLDTLETQMPAIIASLTREAK